jgi:nitrogen-specific signal transduction histidine kinase
VECADTGDCFSDADFSSLFSSNLAFTGTRAVTGLSVVKKIVEMHKGSISGAQKSGKTIFIIKFPACDEKKKE